MNDIKLYTPKYHSLLKWALLASLFIFFLNYGIEYLDYQEYSKNPNHERSFLLNKILYQLNGLVYWSLIGVSIGKLREGLIAFAVSFFLIALPSFFLGINGDYTLVFKFLQFIPALVFGFLIFEDDRKWQMYWLVLISAGVSLIYYSFGIFDIINSVVRRTPFDDLFRIKIYGPEGSSYREFHAMREILQACTLFLQVAAGAWFLDRLKRRVTPIWRSLDLSVQYSSKTSTALFLISKYLIIIGGFSLSQVVIQSAYLPNTYLSQIRLSLQSVESVLGFFAVVAFFRCFLAEFLLSRGYKLGWHFFWLMLPIIGDVVWILNRGMDVNLVDIRERFAIHKKAVIHYPEGLKILILLLTALSVVLSVIRVFPYSGDILLGTLLTGAVAFVLLALYFISDKTVYWIIGLTIFSMVMAILFREEFSKVKFQYDSSISSITNAILFLVIFHLKSFKVYPIRPEKEAQSNDSEPYYMKM